MVTGIPSIMQAWLSAVPSVAVNKFAEPELKTSLAIDPLTVATSGSGLGVVCTPSTIDVRGARENSDAKSQVPSGADTTPSRMDASNLTGIHISPVKLCTTASSPSKRPKDLPVAGLMIKVFVWQE